MTRERYPAEDCTRHSSSGYLSITEKKQAAQYLLRIKQNSDKM